MAAITTANAAQAILKLVATRGLPAVMGNLVMANLVNRNYEPTLASAGDTVNIPVPPVLTTENVAEGGSFTTQSPSIGNSQIVLNSHRVAAFAIPDVTAALTGAERGDFSLLDMYMNAAMIAIAEAVETDIMNLYSNLTVNTDVGTGATALTEDTIDKAEKALFNAKVPAAERKVLVVGADAYSDLRQIERFTETAKLGSGQAIASGQVGKLKDFDVFRSQFVAKPSSTSYNLAFAKDAFGMAMRRLPIPLPGMGAIGEYAEMGGFGMRLLMSYAHSSFATTVSVDILYGIAVLRGLFGVRVLS